MDHTLRVFMKPQSLFPSDIHSDTIAGALIQAFSMLYGNEEAEDLVKGQGFRVSSGFPFVENGDGRQVFYPKPLLEPEKLKRGDRDYMDNMKKYKKVRFIHEDVFNRITEKKVCESDIIRCIGKSCEESYKIKNGLLFPKVAELKFDIYAGIIPHNAINRLTSASDEFFYQTGMMYRGCGMYFILETDSADTMRKLKGAAEFLSDRGIGGGISTGGGQFSIEFDEEFEGLNGNGTTRVLLSLYNPSPDELKAIDVQNSYYSLETRRGVTEAGKLRKYVFMFAPGSTLKTDAELKGRVIAVSEEPPNVEWGLYMGVGFNE